MNKKAAIPTHVQVDRTPLWHNNERQVGVNRPPAMHHVGLGAGALLLGCRFGLEVWPPRMAKHPALAAIPVLDLQIEGDRTPLWHNNVDNSLSLFLVSCGLNGTDKKVAFFFCVGGHPGLAFAD